MKRWLMLISLLITLSFVVSNVTFAATNENDILIKLLVEKKIITQDEADSIKAQVAAIAKDEASKKTSVAVTSKVPVKISGYVQERYSQSPQSGYNDTLEVKRARLSLTGDATSKLDFKVQIDVAGSKKGLTDATLNSGVLTTKSSTFAKPMLLDGVLGYKLSSTDKLSVGQFYTPFGLESQTADNQLDTINRSQVTETLVPGRDNGSQGRDIGTMLSGTKGSNLSYQLGVLNGSGINVSDDNDSKDAAARLVWKPGIKGLSIGAAHYNGKTGATHLAHTRTGGELVWQANPWTLKSEYIWAKDASTHKHGWYATAVRQLNGRTQAVARYDILDPNTSVKGDLNKTLTLGMNWFLNKDGYSRWVVNYEIRNKGNSSVPSNLLMGQFQAGF